MQIEMSPGEYRNKGTDRVPRVKFTFLELLSFAIASTWATRKRTPPDRDRNSRLLAAVMLGVVTYFTSGGS